MHLAEAGKGKGQQYSMSISAVAFFFTFDTMTGWGGMHRRHGDAKSYTHR